MSDYSELAKLAEAAKKNWEDSGLNRCEEVERFINAASPESVLTLIAENDRLDLDNRSLKGSCSRLGAEHAKMTRTLKKANRMQLEARQARDQLKAENEALRKDADKWKIVEHAMESLKSDERNASIWSVCSRLLISTAHKLNSSTSTVVEEVVTIGDLEICDWRVTVERISSPENPS